MSTQVKYFKFNNSRSAKKPFWVYLKCENGSVKSPDGCGWSFPGSDATEISEEEYNIVAKSYEDTANPQVGDDIVVIEFCPASKRYSKVTKVYTFGAGGPNAHERVLLANGENYSMKEVRKIGVIHLE